MKKFDNWNEVKKQIETEPLGRHYKDREIYYVKIGENIGFEQSGKGKEFIRPVLILKKFNKTFFYGVPLSTTKKRGKYYFEFNFINGKTSVAILSQVKSFDTKRLLNKIGMMKQEDFVKIKNEIRKILEL